MPLGAQDLANLREFLEATFSFGRLPSVYTRMMSALAKVGFQVDHLKI